MAARSSVAVGPAVLLLRPPGLHASCWDASAAAGGTGAICSRHAMCFTRKQQLGCCGGGGGRAIGGTRQYHCLASGVGLPVSRSKELLASSAPPSLCSTWHRHRQWGTNVSHRFESSGEGLWCDSGSYTP